MESNAFVTPIPPGKTEEWKQFLREISGPRLKEFEASRRRAGYKRVYVYIQSTPLGDMVVLYHEADDLTQAAQVTATSDDPFDIWFWQRLFAIQGPGQSQPSEAFLEWAAPR